jgi:hypothetical protein
MVALLAYAGGASAHQSSTRDLQGSVSVFGESNIWLKNLYSETTTYSVEVLDKNTMLPTSSPWRSTLINNQVTLGTNELVDIKVTVRDTGKYYVCTKSNRGAADGPIQLSSRVCLRLWNR